MSAVPTTSAGRNLLLDTCAFLDLNITPAAIGPDVLDKLRDPDTSLYVSTATAWEVAIKTRGGKLPGGERLIESWSPTLLALQAESITIEPEDAIRAGSLAWAHRDPFDRMLVAHAIRYNLPIVTSDRAIADAGIVSVVRTR